MELFLNLEETLNKCVARDDLAGARQACNDMATEIHSVPDQKTRFQASQKLNQAREKVNDLASKLMLGDDQSIDLSQGMNVNDKQLSRYEKEMLV